MAKTTHFSILADGTAITVYVTSEPDNLFTITAEAITADGTYHDYDEYEEVDSADELLEEMLRDIPMNDESIMRIEYKVAAICEPDYPDETEKRLRELIKEGKLGERADYYRYCAGVPMLHE